MGTSIRVADNNDAAEVARFFSEVYEAEHGIGSSGALEMLERTIAVLFPPDENPLVLVHRVDDRIEGVAACHPVDARARAELITVQVYDTVQGRGAAQRLLAALVDQCRDAGATVLTTEVPLADGRARGFLRREGFFPANQEVYPPSGPEDFVVAYERPLIAQAPPPAGA